VKEALLDEIAHEHIPIFYGGGALTVLDRVSEWEALPMASVAAGGTQHRIQVKLLLIAYNVPV